MYRRRYQFPTFIQSCSGNWLPPSSLHSSFIFEMHVQPLTICSFCPSRDFDGLLPLIYDVHSSNTKEKIHTTTITIVSIRTTNATLSQTQHFVIRTVLQQLPTIFLLNVFWSSSNLRQCRIRVLLRIKGENSTSYRSAHTFLRVVLSLLGQCRVFLEIAFCLYFYHLSFYSPLFSSIFFPIS